MMLEFITPPAWEAPMYQPMLATRMPRMIPHFRNQRPVRIIHVVVRYMLTSARYAARRLINGGSTVWRSHFVGLLDRSETTRLRRAERRARQCDKTLRRKL
jgi:hypothetical protein